VCDKPVLLVTRSFLLVFLSCLLWHASARAQSCGVWNVTTSAELTTAVTDACTVGGGIIKIAAGTYTINNPITICSDVTLEGGYDGTFTTKSSVAGTSTISRSDQNPEGGANQERLVAFYVNTASSFRFQDLTIETVDATGNGMSTYAIHITNCNNYDITRCQLLPGDGSLGLDGGGGSSGIDGGVGGNGGDGSEDGSCCTAGGAGGTSAAGNPGGTGGNGGPEGSNVGSPGIPGGGAGDGSMNSGGGANGTGGCTNSNTSCSVPGCAAGTPGSPGAAGTGGTNGSAGPSGTFVSFFTPGAAGAIGTGGTDGAGGGGGGGGGGEGGSLVNDGAGAGGGGGGGGGQGGLGGTGGLGGGGSFALYIDANGIGGNVTDCDFAPGIVGGGGGGGTSGTGGLGGPGGNGGNPSCDVGDGGDGGDGGNGGDGGTGGQGQPGARASVYINSGSPLNDNDTTFNLVGQPAITADNLSCTNVNIEFIAASSAAWDLGVSATPQTPSGDTVTTVYSSTGRNNITYGLDVYSGFMNIPDSSILAVLTPSGNINICGVDSVLLTANAGFASYQWQFDGIDIPGATSTTLYAASVGSYTFIGATACCGVADTSAPAVIDILALPVTDAGSGGIECDLDFTFSAVASLGAGAWSMFSGPGSASFGDTISPTDSVSVSLYGTYIFMWTETNSVCADSDTVTVTFTEQPIADAGIGGAACDTSFVLNAVASAGNGTWSQLSGPPASTSSYSNVNSATTIATVSVYGTYVYQWQEVNGICPDSDTVTVTYVEIPVAVAGIGGVICDLDFTLSATPSVGNGSWSQVLGSGTTLFDDSTNASTSITASSPGTYIYRWTEANGMCSSFDDVIVVFSNPVVADAGADTSISLGNSVVLNGQGGFYYQWTPDSTLNNPNIADPTASPLTTVAYVLTATDGSGCIGIDSVRIVVLEDFNFVVSNVMTPNGDAYNDTWYIDNIDFYSECTVSIYNRYGYLLYTKTGYTNDWDGTSGGRVLPDGTYYYIIDCPGKTDVFKGGITILRN